MDELEAFANFRRSLTLMARNTPLARVLEAVAEIIEAEQPSMVCSIVLLEDDGRMRLGAAPNLPAAFSRALDGPMIGPQAGSCGTAMFRQAPVITSDLRVDPLWNDYRQLDLPSEFVACWSAPIILADVGVVGALALYGREPGAPTEAQTAFLAAAAGLATAALDRDRRERGAVAAKAKADAAREHEAVLAREFETLFQVSLDIICIVREGRFIRVSNAFTEILGWSLEEVEGRHYSEFLHPDDRVTAFEAEEALRQTGELAAVRNRYRRRDGTYLEVEWSGRGVDDFVYCVARDVAKQAQFERDREAARAAAEAANQAKSNFLANMSHEIRTPLNGVVGLLGALRRTDLSPDQAEILELMSVSSRTLERLISEILDFSRIEAGRVDLHVAPFALDALLGSIGEEARHQARGCGLTFVREIGDGVQAVYRGDAGRIRQILDNLISNAIKFTPQGEVRLKAAVTRREADDLCTISVEDTGIGFPPDLVEVIFERFHQGDPTHTRKFGGSGLGLAICKALVEMMDGSISASSQLGRGSVFTVQFPLEREGSALLPTEVAVDVDQTAPRALSILLAEDHPVNRRVVELMLAPFDMELTVVENGQEAVSAFGERRFDLVLMDLQMPIMDGLSAIRAIRDLEHEGQGVATPIIALSANAMEHHRSEALAAGANLHVAKPVTSTSLIVGIQSVLASPDPLAQAH